MYRHKVVSTYPFIKSDESLDADIHRRVSITLLAQALTMLHMSAQALTGLHMSAQARIFQIVSMQVPELHKE